MFADEIANPLTGLFQPSTTITILAGVDSLEKGGWGVSSGEFDPYHRWLGIPPKDQPPNHYRLLGLDLFEADPEVIRDAAERQMAHVRTYQFSQHVGRSQQILNELGVAKSCLLDRVKRAAYDELLSARAKPSGEASIPLPPELVGVAAIRSAGPPENSGGFRIA